MNYSNSNKKVKTAESAMMEKAPPNFDPALEKKLLKQYAGEPEKAYATMWTIHNKKNESTTGIRVAKEGIEECWDDMGGQEMMNQGNGEQMSVTISMPGKNISVTTDSADEIGNILRLAGINVGGTAPEQKPEMGSYGGPVASAKPEEIVYVGTGAEGEPSVPEQPTEEPEVEEGNQFTGALAKAKAEHKDEFEVDGKEYDVEEATQTPKPWTDSEGKEHPGTAVKGDRYGNQEDKEDKEVDEAILQLQRLAGITEEDKVEEATKTDKPWTDMSGKEHPGTAVKGDKYGNQEDKEEKDDVDESARILELAGVNEWANSPDSANTEEDTYLDSLPSREGTGAGNKDFGANRANNQGENPMGVHTTDVEEAFANAMGEYRKFVAENIARKK